MCRSEVLSPSIISYYPTQETQALAYRDQPLREGAIHISAPHIYGQVLESLELQPSHSVLNLGSGTGYLSCMMQHLCPQGRIVSVEVDAPSVEHCQTSVAWWQAEAQLALRPLEVITGNAYHLESSVLFDRIYVGAAIDEADLARIVDLLRPGGIFVGPGRTIVVVPFVDDGAIVSHTYVLHSRRRAPQGRAPRLEPVGAHGPSQRTGTPPFERLYRTLPHGRPLFFHDTAPSCACGDSAPGLDSGDAQVLSRQLSPGLQDTPVVHPSTGTPAIQDQRREFSTTLGLDGDSLVHRSQLVRTAR